MNRACFSKNTTKRKRSPERSELNLHEQNRYASCIRPLKNNFVRMKITYLIFFAICLFLVNCQSRNDKNAVITGQADDTASIGTLEDLTYLLLSPNEILDEILAKQITFAPGIVNPKENAGKYIDTKRIALNLGVYIADFAYLSLNQNRTNSLEYFKIIRDLAHKNNIYSGIDKGLFDRIQNNLTHNDSLIDISEEIYYQMSDDLENANRQNIYSLIATGALIESMYLSVMNVSGGQDSLGLVQKIFDQRQLFDSFYDFISGYKNDPDVKQVIGQIDNLREILNNSHKKTTKMSVKKDRPGHISVQGGEGVEVTGSAFREFKNYTIKAREEIISVN